MSTLRSNTDDGAAAVPPVTQPSAPAPRALLRRVGWSTFVLCAALVLMAGAGFLWFIWRVPAEELYRKALEIDPNYSEARELMQIL